MRSSRIALLVAVVLVSPLVAQERVGIPRSPSQESGVQARLVAIKAGRIIDGTGRAPLDNAVVVVHGGRIETIGPQASVKIPAGAEIIDLPTETLLPGLIDTHGHLNVRTGLAPGGALAQDRDPDGIQMLRMVRNARVSLLCGVTTVRMVGKANWNDLHLRNSIRAGMVPGPRLILGGPGISATGGTSSPWTWADGPLELVKHVREHYERGAEWVKVRLVDRSPEGTMLSLEELKALTDEAHRLGIRVTAHATGRWGSSVKTAILAGVDNIEHARPMTDEIIQLMVKHGTTVSFTPLNDVSVRPRRSTWEFLDRGARGPAEWIEYGRKQYFDFRKAHPEAETEDRPRQSDPEIPTPDRDEADYFPSIHTLQSQALAAHRAGVQISLGLDTIYYGGVGNAIEFLIEGGFSPMDAIRAATAVAARNIGYGDRLGTIEPGKLADMISLRANPLNDRWAWSKVHLVMKEGERYDTLSWK